MADYAVNPDALQAVLAATLGERVRRIGVHLGELTVVVDAADYLQSALLLDAAALPAGLGAPISGNGGLSELVLAPKGDRFTLVWQTPSGLSMITAPVPK